MKYLSNVANDVLRRSTEILDSSMEAVVEEFELRLKPEPDDYPKKLVEFCASKAIGKLCCNIDEKISDGSFSRFTFNAMLAWDTPRRIEELPYTESAAKEKEDRKETLEANPDQVNDDIPLFYSDIMPLLVNDDRSVGEEGFVWISSVLPLAADIVNARFTFDTLTAPTASRLYFPAYDRYLKEINKCFQNLKQQSTPIGVELGEGEFILHVDGTPATQRVVRHIGSTSWPGRLTLTNQALYFEASSSVTYENALVIGLSDPSIDHRVRTASTGPLGVPLFNKAIVYESNQLTEPVVLEFPEITSSTRRDHWLALIKEIVLSHSFISKFEVEFPLKAWEMSARTILGVVRLHAAREMLRIATPMPTSFLIFSLFDELPKGDYVLEELSNSLKHVKVTHPCSATSVLKNFGISNPVASSAIIQEEQKPEPSSEGEQAASIDTTVTQVRETAKDILVARATVEGLKGEGITEGLLILVGLLIPLKEVINWLQSIFRWERPGITLTVLTLILLITYKEWIGYSLAAALMATVGYMLWARRQSIRDRFTEVIVDSSSDQSTMENIAAAQDGLNKLREMVPMANILVLKIHSILVSRAPKQANHVMLIATGAAAMLVMIPFKFLIMTSTLIPFLSTLRSGNPKLPQKSNRRLKEWWESIPVAPVKVVAESPQS